MVKEKMDIMKKIERWMRAKRLRQVDVAERIGCTRANVSDKFKPNRRPNFTTVYEIVQACDKYGVARKRMGTPDQVSMSKLAGLVDRDSLFPYDAVERFLDAMGYEIVYYDKKTR